MRGHWELDAGRHTPLDLGAPLQKHMLVIGKVSTIMGTDRISTLSDRSWPLSDICEI